MVRTPTLVAVVFFTMFLPMWVAIFVSFSKNLSQKHIFESFKWGIIFIDFVGFLFKIFKFKNDINYIKYKFSHIFGKVCKWLNMYYSNIKIIIIFKVTTMSIRIILKNLVWTCRKCNFCQYWATVACIYPPMVYLGPTQYSLCSHRLFISKIIL